MKPQIDHDTCSALLLGYVRGDVPEQDRVAVEEHLSACERCSREHAALLALSPNDVEPLSEHERRRLRRGVLTQVADQTRERRAQEDEETLRHAALGAVTPTRTEAPPGGGPWLARLFPALGAAAIVILVIGAIGYIALIGDAGEDAAGPGVTSVEGEAEGRGGAAGEADEEHSSLSRTDAAVAPVFDARRGRVEQSELARLGRTGKPFTTLATRYEARDVNGLRDAFLERLAEAAPAGSDAEQVRTCARTVFSSQDFEILPAYARLGELDGRDVLVLGFVWSDDASGPLSRFMIWAWPRGSCEEPPVVYEAGSIKR